MTLLTSDEVAKILGFNAATIRRFTRDGKIDTIVIGKARRYTQEAVDKFIREHTLPSNPPDEGKHIA